MNGHLRLRTFLHNLQSTLWFRPAAATLIAVLLAILITTLDQLPYVTAPALLRIGVDSARAVLAAVAGAMLAVVGMIFSILMVALVLASQQFSPRILRNFVRDRTSQDVLSIFIGSFVYSLLVLARISEHEDRIFTPVVSVTVAIVLALFSMASLIHFIDHITRTIRANNIIADINERTEELFNRLYEEDLANRKAEEEARERVRQEEEAAAEEGPEDNPEDNPDDNPEDNLEHNTEGASAIDAQPDVIEHPPIRAARSGKDRHDGVMRGNGALDGVDESELDGENDSDRKQVVTGQEVDVPPWEAAEAIEVAARRPGYIQVIDHAALVRVAQAHGILIRVERGVGDFVARDNLVMSFLPTREKSQELYDSLHSAYSIGTERTLFGDLLFGIRQLVDIALRALAPATNDPTTAANCVDYLGNLLILAARRPDLQGQYRDSAGYLRVIVPRPTFVMMLDEAFDQIRQYSGGEVTITWMVLNVLAQLAQATSEPERHAALWRHACMISRGVDRNIHEPLDREKINDRLYELAARTGNDVEEVLLSLPKELQAA